MLHWKRTTWHKNWMQKFASDQRRWRYLVATEILGRTKDNTWFSGIWKSTKWTQKLRTIECDNFLDVSQRRSFDIWTATLDIETNNDERIENQNKNTNCVSDSLNLRNFNQNLAFAINVQLWLRSNENNNSRECEMKSGRIFDEVNAVFIVVLFWHRQP